MKIRSAFIVPSQLLVESIHCSSFIYVPLAEIRTPADFIECEIPSRRPVVRVGINNVFLLITNSRSMVVGRTWKCSGEDHAALSQCPFAFFDLQPVKPAANDAITCPELAQKHGSRLLLDPILALTVLPFLQGYPFVLAKPLHPLA